MMTHEEESRLAEVTDWYRELPDGVRESVREKSMFVNVPNGHCVFDDGDECPAFKIVVDGTLRVTKVSESGRSILLYEVNPGESCVLTLECLMGKSNYPARGVTFGEVSGVLIPKDLFFELMEDSREFRSAVFATMGRRLSSALETLQEVAFHNVDQRLANHILSRADGAELLTTHQRLSEDLGCSREVVSRTLETFKTRGWLSTERGRIVLLNPDEMRDTYQSM